jgi:hypothetical protein
MDLATAAEDQPTHMDCTDESAQGNAIAVHVVSYFRFRFFDVGKLGVVFVPKVGQSGEEKIFGFVVVGALELGARYLDMVFPFLGVVHVRGSLYKGIVGAALVVC